MSAVPEPLLGFGTRLDFDIRAAIERRGQMSQLRRLPWLSATRCATWDRRAVKRQRHLVLAPCLLASASLACGCSTIGTLNGTLAREWNGEPMHIPWIYAGVQYDFYGLTVSSENFALLDLPFSLVADTLVLPFTIYAQLRWGSRHFGPSENSELLEDAELHGAVNPESLPKR